MAERRTSRSKSSGSRRPQRARKQARAAARGRGATGPAAKADVSAKSVAELREALRKNLIRPLELVMLTRERIEEVLEEAVERGRVTAEDAQGIASALVQRGRKQTNDVLKDLERLMGRGRAGVAGRTLRRAARAGFPISAYDELTAAQIQSRLGELTPAQLRKVRDYERRNANRKTVLNAVEAKLH